MIHRKWDVDTDRAIDGSHVASIRVDVHRVDGHLWLWDKLFVMVCFKIPDMDHTTLISNKQFALNINTHKNINAILMQLCKSLY